MQHCNNKISSFCTRHLILIDNCCLSKIKLGRVRILIKIRLKLNFDRFTMEKMSNFIFNRILMSIRTRPKTIPLKLPKI
jgi:hypothetical protein